METSTQKYVIGVDIGGTHLRIGAVTPEKEMHFFQKMKTEQILDFHNPIESLASFLREYIEKYIGYKHVLAIGIGFPSVISKDKKSIYSTPNLEYLDNINIVDSLQELLHIPVYIEKDVNYLMEYEISKRSLQKDATVLGFFIGTGFGNSIYLQGQFYRGKNGAAGELGHIPVLGNNDPCGCGNPSCIESIASGKKLVSLHQQYFSDVPFKDIFTKYASSSVLMKFIQTLAIPIATEINIFDPDLILIGGGVMGMKDFPKDQLEKEIILHSRKPYPANGLQMEYTEDHPNAGVLGAAIHIYEKLIHFKAKDEMIN